MFNFSALFRKTISISLSVRKIILPFFLWILAPVLILTSAFITNGIIIFLFGYNPIEAYAAAIGITFGSVSAISETLVKSTPFLMTGLSVAIAFRCGMWNIGAEGQFLIGVLAATWFGTKIAILFPNTSWIAVPLCLSFAILAGGIWGIIPAILKVTRGVNEVISTIMLNYIAIHFVSLMIDGGPLQETSKTGPQSDPIAEWVFLPRLFEAHRIHLGTGLAVILAIVLTFVLFRTTFGYQLRAVGEGAAAAEAAGISISQNTLRVFFISGALAGLGGAIEIMALVPHRLTENFSPDYGYTAIAVALLAKLHPLMTVATALLFGALAKGSFAMEAEVGISRQVTLMMQAIILLFVIGASAVNFFRKYNRQQKL
ncbi:MAG: ABC transporter permease [Candidatus Poribacteria bacterium]|nr:ABC transporter permease [Candidatus Poribacteria bacterium]